MKKYASRILAVALLVGVFAAAAFCCCSAERIQSLYAAKSCSHCPKEKAAHDAPDPKQCCFTELSFAELPKAFSLGSLDKKFVMVVSQAAASVAYSFNATFHLASLDGPDLISSVPIYIRSHNLRL